MEGPQPKRFFDRDDQLGALNAVPTWDVIIIGGGATGLGAAVDSAARGFKTLLLEQADFAKGTSSRSTKLVHGGVRYLAQGDVGLVYEALRERGYLLKNAPHVVKKQPFIIPCFSRVSALIYLVGMKVYDWMAGRYRFGRSIYLSREQALKALPGVNETGLLGGVGYFDGQFDDSRLAINLAQTCVEKGGTVLNYLQVTGLLKDEQGIVNGVKAYDLENERAYLLHSKTVINATGVFVDDVLTMDTPLRRQLVRPSQGVHLVFDRQFLKGRSALMIPKTSDGRVLFAVPWHDHILVGTTDTPVVASSIEPKPLSAEVDFILRTISQYLTRAPHREDILSVFAGLRPLAASAQNIDSTKEISRSHKILVANSKLITIVGGKWTTYRKMAEDAINRAVEISDLQKVRCYTESLEIHGFAEWSDDSLGIYGSDRAHIVEIVARDPRLGEKMHPRLSYILAEVIWAVRNEMARSIEDVLARRTRALFLDARAAIDSAPIVAELMATELSFDEAWQRKQINDFVKLAGNYLLEPYPAKALTPVIPENDEK